MNKIFYSFLCVTIIGMIFAGQILPDSQNPLVFSANPSVNTAASSLTFTFNLANSSGLGYNQFLAVILPQFDSGSASSTNLGTSNFKLASVATAGTCSLYVGSTAVAATWVVSPTGEDHVYYCQVTDMSQTYPLSASATWTLTITLTTAQKGTAAIFYRNLDVITTTSAQGLGKGVIIDTGFGFGNAALFADHTGSANKLLTIEEVARCTSTGANDSVTTTYQYSTYNVRLRLKAQTLIRGADSILLITYPNNQVVSVLPALTGYSSAVYDSTSPLKAAIAGTLVATVASTNADGVSPNAHYVTGFTDEWLVQNREFYLIGSSLKAGDGAIAAQNISVTLFYKNTNTVQSYSFATYLTTTVNTVTLAVQHPDTWDIYMGGAWPLIFTYQATTATLTPTNGAYVVIKHNTYIPLLEAWNFIASTCDFTQTTADTTQFAAGFGGRTLCFPIQAQDNNFGAYSGSLNPAASANQGSGFYFRQQQLAQSKAYVVLVWGVADVCGPQAINTLSNATSWPGDPLSSTAADAAFRTLSFSINIYNGIDQTKFADNRFTSTGIYNIGTATSSSGPKCYSTFRGGDLVLNGAAVSAIAGGYAGFEQYVYVSDASATNVPTQIYNRVTATAGNWRLPASTRLDVLLYKEFTDPIIFNAPTSGSSSLTGFLADNTTAGTAYTTAATCQSSSGYGLTLSTTAACMQPNFLFSDTTANVVTQTSVLVRGDFTISVYKASTTYDSKHGFPTPVWKNSATAGVSTNNVDGLWIQNLGGLEVYYSKNWFDKNSASATIDSTMNSCSVAWNISASDIAADQAVQTATNAGFIDETSSTTSQTVAGLSKTWYYNSYAGPNSAGSAAGAFALADFPLVNTNVAADSRDLRNNFMNNKVGSLATFNQPNSTKSTIVSFLSTVATESSQTDAIATSIIGGIATAGVKAYPGGRFVTVNPGALGFQAGKPTSATIAQIAASKTSWTCTNTIAGKACNYSFYLFTNCLQFSTTPLTKTLYNYLDIIYLWRPILTTTAIGNGPNRVVRFIKLFPETQAFNDVARRQVGTANAVNLHSTIASVESIRGSNNNYKGFGMACLVEIVNAQIMPLMTSTSNTLAIFLFNLSLLDTDASDFTAQYPIGSLATGVKAWGLNSAPAYTRFGQMGCLTTDDTTLTRGNNIFGLNKLVTAYNPVTNPIQGVEPLGYGRSAYNFLLGSVVLLTGVTPAVNASVTAGALLTTPNTQNLWIPTRCPVGAPAPATTTYGAAAIPLGIANSGYATPTIYIASMVASDHNTFTTVTKVLKHYNAASTTTGNTVFPLTTKTLMLSIGDGTNYVSLQAEFMNYASAAATTDLSTLKIWNTTASAATFTAIQVFLNTNNKIITLNANTAGVGFGAVATSSANNMSYYQSTTSYFYFQEKKFNAALAYVTSTTAIAANKATALSIFGIIRPASLSSFLVSPQPTSPAYTGAGSFSLQNQLAVVATDLTASVIFGSTSQTNTSATSYNFELLIETDARTGSEWVTTTTADKTSQVFLADFASNIKIVTSVPIAGTNLLAVPAIPVKGLLYISWSLITANTVCGINTTGLAQECTATNVTTVLRCPISTASTTYTICCYGFNNTGANNPGPGALYVELNGVATATTAGVTAATNYLFSYVPAGTTPTTNNLLLAFDSTAANTTNPNVSTLNNTLGPVTWSVPQIGAIGRATFQYNLAREVVRDGKIVIAGDFSSFFTGINTTFLRCEPTFLTAFGTDWTKGDQLIDTCDLTNVATTTNTIIVNMKKITWQCGVTFSKTLIVALYPVVFATIPTANTYSVVMNTTGGAVTNASTGLTYTTSLQPTVQLAKPTAAFLADTLCPVQWAGIYPRIPGALVDITFDFQLNMTTPSTIKATLDAYMTVVAVTNPTARNVNELMIFLPQIYFGNWGNSAQQDLMCMYNNARAPCSFDSTGILYIKFPAGLATTQVQSVTLLNIQVGALDTDISFPCSVNNVSSTGVRTNLYNGSGKMGANPVTTAASPGITQRASVANTYNLRYFPEQVPTPGQPSTVFLVSDLQPRISGTTISLRVGVDFNGSQLGPTAITINNSPVFHFYLPNNFKSLWYQFQNNSQLKPTVTINHVTVDANANLTSTPLVLNTPTFSGNRITVGLTATSLLIPVATATQHVYFNVQIGGLINPVSAGNTGRINTIITNSDYTYLLRTWDTAFSQSTSRALTRTVLPVPTTASNAPTSDPILAWQRGLLFSLQNKWDANILGSTNNSITVNAGRYGKYTWTVTANAALALTNPASTTITSSDSVLQFPAGSNYVLSSTIGTVVVQLGCACASTPGRYVLFLNSSSTNFLPLPPQWVNLSNATTATITVVPAGTFTIPGGVLNFNYNLLGDTNFDTITATWGGPTPNTLDSSATLTFNTLNPNSVSTTGLFQITNATTTLAQTFVLVPLTNTCFTFSQTTVTVALTGTAAALTSATTISSWFTFKTPATDTTLQPSRLNSLHWTVLPTVAPVNVYCAVLCNTFAAPMLQDVVNQSITTLPAGVPSTAGPLVAYYNSYFPTLTAQEYYFNNLTRGQVYQLSCVVQTTQASTAARTSVQYNATATVVTGNSTNTTQVNYNQQTISVEPTVCGAFTFVTGQTTATQAAISAGLTSYCQNAYAANSNPGCVVCFPYNGTIPANAYTGINGGPVLPSPANVTCPTPKSRLRYLTTPAPAPAANTTNTTTKVVIPTFSVSVCAVPSVTCPSNVATTAGGLLATMTTGVTATLNTAALFAQNLPGVTGTVAVSAVSVVTDTAAPALTGFGYSLTGAVLPPTTAGYWNVTLNYAGTTPLNCYYQVSNGATSTAVTAPTASNLQTYAMNSANSASSGNFLLTAPSTSIANTDPSIVLGNYYNIFVVCYNNVPGAQYPTAVQSLPSAVQINCPSGQTISANKCVTPAPAPSTTPASTNNTNSTTPASYISMSLLMIFAAIMIFFN